MVVIELLRSRVEANITLRTWCHTDASAAELSLCRVRCAAVGGLVCWLVVLVHRYGVGHDSIVTGMVGLAVADAISFGVTF